MLTLELNGLKCPTHGVIENDANIEFKRDIPELVEACPYCNSELTLNIVEVGKKQFDIQNEQTSKRYIAAFLRDKERKEMYEAMGLLIKFEQPIIHYS